ncbi:MAG TPA: APC family permease [Rhizomicrobium sp.]|nr:APC family permease [Rhizomicrobium sp.]
MPESVVVPPNTHGHLLRILGVTFGVAVAIGGMIGAGILRTPSSIAALVPDAGLIVALWVLGALQAALEANVFSELGTAMPKAGGLYVYAHRAFGDVGGLAVGWTVWCARLSSAAALSVAFTDFLALVWPFAGAHSTAVALAMLVAIFGLNAVGVREGSSVQKATSFAKALALAAFCIVAFAAASPSSAAAPAMAAPAIGLMGAVGAYQMIVGAYSGWYEPLFFAEENTDPAKNIPRAMFIGIAVGAVLYVSVNLGLIHALGVRGMAQGALPYTTILSRAIGPAAGTLFAIGAMIIVASCTNAGVMTAPRVLLGLARDRLLPARLADVNRGGSPWIAMLMTAAGAMLLALIGVLDKGVFSLLFGLIGTLSVAAQLLTIAAIFVLRRREPGMARPYRALGYPWLPAFALAVDAALLLLFLEADWLGALIAATLWAACIPFAWIARRARAVTA